MKDELLTDEEPDSVTAGLASPQISASENFSAPKWLDDVKSEMNHAELVPLHSGSVTQKLKAIYQRMQLD